MKIIIMTTSLSKKNNFYLCVICKEKVAVLKEYNIRRHFETKQASAYNDLI